MQALLQDVRFGLRILSKTPIFTAIAILILALSIGANTAIFSLVNALLFRPIQGVGDPAQLVQLLRVDRTGVSENLSYQDCLDFQKSTVTLAGIAMQRLTPLHLSTQQPSERITGAMITGNYFELLGVTPVLGRLIGVGDVQTEGASPIVVLNYDFWLRRFGGDQQIVGQTVNLNGVSYTVIGVAAEAFSGIALGETTEVWIPLTMWRQADPELSSTATKWNVNWFSDRDATWLTAFGRLKPERRVEQAQAELSTIALTLAQAYPKSNQEAGVQVTVGLGLLPDIRSKVQQFAKLPFVIVVLVLFVACANVAGMMLSKAHARQKEISIRYALGATRWQVTRQLLTESVLLSLTSGILGLFITTRLGHLLLVTLPETYLNTSLKLDINLDLRVLSFTLAISVLTGVLFGIIPAWRLSQCGLIQSIKSQSDSTGRTGKIRIRNLFAPLQLAISFALLITAALCVQTLQNVSAIKTGFNTERVLTARLDLGRQNYTDFQRRVFYQHLIERMDILPEVKASSLATNITLSGLQPVTRIYPQEQSPGLEYLSVNYNVITPRYFETVEVSLLLGRPFSVQDTQQSPAVAIINEMLAQRLWPNETPLGKRFRFGNAGTDNPLIEIVGVASDTKGADIFAPPRLQLYLPLTQQHQDQAVLFIRTRNAPEQFIPTLHHEMAAIDPTLPLYAIKTLADYFYAAIAPQRLAAFLVSVFGILAILLAGIGLYGTMAYDVERRTSEIGIRLALGAQARDIFFMIMRQGGTFLMTGAVIGLVVVFSLTPLIKGFLFGVKASDPMIYLMVSLVMVLVGLIACYFPARRALRVDLIKSLREE